MRGTRWLLLVAIAVILGAVAITYRAQKKSLEAQTPAAPPSLDTSLASTAQHWHHQVTNHGRLLADIDAEDFSQARDFSTAELKGLSIKQFSTKGDTYNLIKSAAGSFSTEGEKLYSEGDVEMTLNLPVQGPSKRTPVTIRSSGVTFDPTGKSDTDRAVAFTFENGNGTATGATYDPSTREVLLKKEVVIHWKKPGSEAAPVTIEAGSLRYKEGSSEIWLQPWARLVRGTSTVEGENPVVKLKEGTVEQVQATHARGVDNAPGRKLEYSADELWVDFAPGAAVRKITAQTNAKLLSTTAAAETSVAAHKVEMNFDLGSKDTLLRQVIAIGGAVMTSRPRPSPGRLLAETHTLRGEYVEMKMKADGKQTESVQVPNTGTIEFLPNLPTQRRRRLDGRNLIITYGEQNRMQSLSAREARTETEPTADEKKRKRVKSTTSSQELLARFEPRTGRLVSMDQTGDFAYQEGVRQARAAKATLDSAADVILLDTAARVWDDTGSAQGDRIRINQANGDFTAEGSVRSSRVSDKGSKDSGGMLSGDEPVHAQARHMDSLKNNRQIHYEGDALMWQGANRIQGDTIDVDREKHTLLAVGHVISNLWETPKDKDAKPQKPVMTDVRAARLLYTDETRLAYYTGGVRLKRGGLDEKSNELRAYLSAASQAGSSLDRAVADGAVEVVMAAPARTRTGSAEHCEYYSAEQKVVLRGGSPRLVDSKEGTAQGAELTYFANNDRLLINGSAAKPAQSRVRQR
jgi:lipopolysaccharide export system protein LptA